MLVTYLISLLVMYLPTAMRQGALPPWWAPLGVLGLLVLNALACWLGSRYAARAGNGSMRGTGEVRIFKMLKLGIIAFVFVDVFVFDWPNYVIHLFGDAVVPVAPDIILILPIILMVATFMIFRYRYELSRQGGTRAGQLSMWQYVLLRFRMELAILIVPWLFIVAVSDITAFLWRGSPYYAWIDGSITIGMIICLLTLGPAVLRYVWATSPLPEGSLRDRLEEIGDTHDFRCRDILIWHTHKHIPNAAVIGPLPFARYVLVTDALIENCTDEEIAGIFAHEVAHIVHHHMRFYLLFALMFIVILLNLSEGLTQLGMGGLLAGLITEQAGQGTGILMLVFTLFYWIVGFGYVSRRMEQQADLFALRDCVDPEGFIRALEKLSLLSGRPAETGSWRHFSIARRTKFLRAVVEDPDYGHKIEKKARNLRMGVAVLFTLNLLLMVLM